ncbi:tRNA (guanosine(37)-N1)-methyltransferase TrmD [Mycoplasma yeatsii]|uniref:tRNA (guanine-N(1)-)-methyltransferase n=1 Tax=Mycoplasma yeatsii TaxID=51365 RepID=A0ABU0NF29_9MOLU|nr:tRNA (guanosine(37)-N1)-methyltransferase TrmD [Mycoplasma yeatsii]AJM71851.1 tRNA (guanine-N1)-methyltransferase [Mycoplasma yeatsii GM274B]MDQ0568048.1 tRNA (guanine37-N1)-methyltransferase [Mycoplasma yeatsii]
MKFTIITLFPQMIKSYISESIIKKAIQKNAIEVEILDIRDFTNLSHNQVDDYQYGGGKGMVLMPQPVVSAIESVKTDDSIVILTTPQGKTWNQNLSKQYANNYKHIIIVCGHYEGFDERILDYVDVEISIGDYVLTGGELPALIMLDSISRILPNVIATESHQNESFENNLLDHPVYTKPYDFRGKKVPDVLLSGHHANISKWRDEQQIINTFKKRPDLIDESKLNKIQLELYKKMKGEQ